jgi:hypothetical protein
MSTCTLVGRISYKSLSTLPLEDWIKLTWLPLLGYSPEVLYLNKGWLGFHCNSPDDATLLLSSLWAYGGSSLMLKRWRLAFDPDTEYFQFRHIWVLLPGLPLHLWNDAAFRAIGGSLGRFIALDPQTLAGPSRRIGRVLVELDISSGLPAILANRLEREDFSFRNWTTSGFLSAAISAGKLATSAAPALVSHLWNPLMILTSFLTHRHTWKPTLPLPTWITLLPPPPLLQGPLNLHCLNLTRPAPLSTNHLQLLKKTPSKVFIGFLPPGLTPPLLRIKLCSLTRVTCPINSLPSPGS